MKNLPWTKADVDRWMMQMKQMPQLPTVAAFIGALPVESVAISETGTGLAVALRGAGRTQFIDLNPVVAIFLASTILGIAESGKWMNRDGTIRAQPSVPTPPVRR